MKNCKNLFLFMDKIFSNFTPYILISKVTSSCDISKEIKDICMYIQEFLNRTFSFKNDDLIKD